MHNLRRYYFYIELKISHKKFLIEAIVSLIGNSVNQTKFGW